MSIGIGTDFRNHFPTLMPHIIRILTSAHFHKVRPVHEAGPHQSISPAMATAAGVGPGPAAAQSGLLPPNLDEALRLNFPGGRSPLGASPVVLGGSPWTSPPPAPTTIPLASITATTAAGPMGSASGPSVTSSAPSSPPPSLSDPPILTLASSPPPPLSSLSLTSPPLPNRAAVDLLVLEETLKLLQQMGPNLDDLLHLVLPHVVKLLDCSTLPLVSLRYPFASVVPEPRCSYFSYVFWRSTIHVHCVERAHL